MINLEGTDQKGPPMPAWQSALRIAGLVLPLVALGVFYNWGAVAFVVALIACIILHELGHFLAAKKAGMKVTQFFLFFGPRVWSFRRGETEYGVRLIPAGAFVKVPGMHNLDTDYDPADEQRTFKAAPYRWRLTMAAAGSLMHFAIALILMAVAYGAYGFLKPANTWSVREVVADSPAAAAGLQQGDRVTQFDGHAFTTYEAFATFLHTHEGQTVTLDIDRGGLATTIHPTLGSNPDKCHSGGFLGFAPIFDEPVSDPRSVPGAVVESFTQFGVVAKTSVGALGKIMSLSGLRSYGSSVSSGCGTNERFVSPIGAVKIGSMVAKSGANGFLLFLAQANIFIGIINWVPLLPFDGGHMAIATYERIRSRKGKRYQANVGAMMPFAYAIMLLMLVLGLGNGYLDLFHLNG
jgi:membrane-associated protease RseP (regulator of RpoE activity)